MHRRVLAACLCMLGLAPSQAQPVRSLLEQRQENLIVQQWDISCGAAALATLLTHHHGLAVSEEEVARQMLGATDPLKVRHRGGFSLLDLKRYVQAQGLEADAYTQVDDAALQQMAPAIVPVNLQGYPHFVIYRGRMGDVVLISDPAFGHRRLRADQFAAAWQQNIAFQVQGPSALPQSGLGIQTQDRVGASAQALRQLLR